MTLREKVAEVKPDLVGEEYADGVFGCPYEYSFLKFDDSRCMAQGDDVPIGTCRKCWDQEYVPAETEDHPAYSELVVKGSTFAKGKTVDHPAHYNIGKYECIDEMVAVFGVEQVKAFCRCNVYKYRYRATQKGGEEDLQKAEWYMDFLMKLEGRENRNVTLL